MKFIFTLLITLFFVSSLQAQTWNLEAGNNITRYVFTNSAGNNPDFLKSSSGLHLSLSRENKLSKAFVYDVGLAYNQYNNVGDVQNIPFSYQADFMGLTGGIGPSYTGLHGLTVSAKASAAVQTLINGTQFLQNRYLDLSDDDQFSGLKFSVGFTLSITKKVNDQMAVYTSFQHLDTNTFGSSTLNFVPSTFSFGLKIATK
ncbi:hypothetical protein [Aquirufa antheringensis]|jgi:hypothetical protein|uniref:hypothetical protein n=1 Tax=Aquirufa antheringensis TaxID=2516559 RepID=UPI001F8E1222|nr:hypothetical protein [Aquirufa antheringensis]MCE4217668.1 hypothetical protein [Pseudarcicella sp. GAP-15]MCZ2487283.1 hypothetical protein [Aquirufa antheringensis]MCZ2489732.1 hypothetical protein [Aquirufa antheringensis]USQ03655.1 hypothetical protein G9X63_05885 [Aquirufa antheringensis]